MFSYTRCLYLIVLIACFARTAYAIHCYNCESDYDSRCEQPFNQSIEFVISCDDVSAPSYVRNDYGYNNPSAVGCMEKIVSKGDGVTAVFRSCFWGDIADQKKGCRNPPWATYETVSCNVCDYSKCNSENYYLTGSSNVPRSISVMTALFFALIRWM